MKCLKPAFPRWMTIAVDSTPMVMDLAMPAHGYPTSEGSRGEYHDDIARAYESRREPRSLS